MNGPMAHVYVSLPPDDSGKFPYTAEELDATPLGGGRFRIEAAPAFVFGLCAGDIVRAELQFGDSTWWVREVLEPSPDWLVRVVPKNDDDHPEILEAFTALGCRARVTQHAGLVTIVVPASVSWESVRAVLEADAHRRDTWHFEVAVNPPGMTP